MTTVDTTELERMVDRYRLAHVIEMLAHICYRKATSIGSKRNENALADDWCKAGRTVVHVVTNKSIRAISDSY